MTMLQDRFSVRCAQMEDGEVIGTIQQLSDRLGLAGTGLDQLLILDAGALGVLRDCAGGDAAGA